MDVRQQTTVVEEKCSDSFDYITTSIQSIQTADDSNNNSHKSSLIESVAIEDTNLGLTYSSEMQHVLSTYQSEVSVTLTGHDIPNTLWRVHVEIEIEGNIFQETLESQSALKWSFKWNGLDTYGQKVYGQTMTIIKAGYEFTDCQFIEWDTKIAYLQGYASHGKDFYGWNLDFHHKLDPISAVMYHGTGVRTDLTNGLAHIEDLYDMHSEENNEIPVAITSDGRHIIYLGTNSAVYQLDMSKSSVSYYVPFNTVATCYT
jgi:hypothetical protein